MAPPGSTSQAEHACALCGALRRTAQQHVVLGARRPATHTNHATLTMHQHRLGPALTQHFDDDQEGVLHPPILVWLALQAGRMGACGRSAASKRMAVARVAKMRPTDCPGDS